MNWLDNQRDEDREFIKAQATAMLSGHTVKTTYYHYLGNLMLQSVKFDRIPTEHQPQEPSK